MHFSDFEEIWVTDFEFRNKPGEWPNPICMVALELHSGAVISHWRDDLRRISQPPFGVGPRSLILAYSCTAELGCFRALGWQYPLNVLDLFVEFRNLTNFESGERIDSSLPGALLHFRCASIEPQEKDDMRTLILSKSAYTREERQRILLYCQRDVEDTARLLKKMQPHIDLDRALLRGRYGKAATEMEARGVPVDLELLCRMQANWSALRLKLIDQVDTDYGVFESGHLRFDLLKIWAERQDIDWPRTPQGQLRTDKTTLKELALRYPILEPLAETLRVYRQLKKLGFPVGSDGRNRCSIMPFASKTGRNQPRTSEFLLSGPTWLRSPIRPEPGKGLAYVDWERQEFGMGAALSRDERMMDAYLSEDCYLAFGKQAGVLPAHATKESHPKDRDRLKSALLSIQYQCSGRSLSNKIGVSESEAEQLIQSHHHVYKKYWEWIHRAEACFLLESHIQSVFGWTLRRKPGRRANMRSVSNFPIQSNGAEMMRLACCIAIENGVEVCAPLHDAFLIEARVDELDDAVRTMKQAMQEASRIVLNGFSLKTDSQVFRYPERFRDPRGDRMWGLVMNLLNEVDGGEVTCA